MLRHGDLSVLSFHATKVFNTFEGGAIVCPDAKTKKRIDQLKNFGFTDEVTVVAPGINGKMSEFNAALGLLQLKHVDAGNRSAAARSMRCTASALGRHAQGLRMPGSGLPAHAVQPRLLSAAGGARLSAVSAMHCTSTCGTQGMHGRRYFYPLISAFPMYRGLPSRAADQSAGGDAAASQVICLPIYPASTDADVHRIAALIRECRVSTPAALA